MTARDDKPQRLTDAAIIENQQWLRDTLPSKFHHFYDALVATARSRCQPVYGSCNLPSGHTGKHDAYAASHALHNPANPERRFSLEHSEVKPDGNEKRSGEVDREGGGSAGTARSDAVGAGRAECGSRASGRERDREESVAGEGASVPSTTPRIPAYYVAVHTGGEPYDKFDFPIAENIGFKSSPNGAWMRAHDVIKAFAASAIALNPLELQRLIDYHDNAESGAEAQDYFDSARFHRERSEHFKKLLHRADGGKQT